MKKLELNQMESLEAGGCAWSAIGLGLTFAGAFLVTGPIGAGIFAASFIHGSIGLANDCGGGGSRQQLMKYDEN